MKRNDTEIKLAVTGSSWMKRGVGSIQSLMRETLSKAKDEVLIAAYSISANKEFLQMLEDLLIRGIRVSIIANKFNNQHKSVQKILKKMGSKYNKFILFSFEPADDFEDLHAKLIVVDHSSALVGSANISEQYLRK